MTTSDFVALVERVEQHASANPRAYRRRLLLLAAAGYGYIVAVLLALIVLAVTLLFVSVAAGVERWSVGGFAMRYVMQGAVFAILGAIYFSVRGLFARIPAPDGLRLRRPDAPALFEAIEEARRAARGPRIHRVLLTDEFNAAVLQRPLLGPFGFYVNDLLIGLPLLDALSPDELRAVLAHEIGHLSGNHSRLAGRILAVRRTWMSLLDGMQRNQPIARFLFTPFFGWYAPYFAAYSLVMARDQEREADRTAASLAGSRALADALTKLAVRSGFVDDTFRPALSRLADSSPVPPATLLDDLRAALQADLPPEEAETRLAAALAEEADVADSHPSLAQRLAALNEAPRIPPGAAISAAEQFLGQALGGLRTRLNQTWQAQARERWEERYNETQAHAARLNELEAQAGRQPLSIREEWERANLTGLVHGYQWAIPRLRQLVRSRPSSPYARLALARALFEQRDDAGLAEAEMAVRLSPETVDEALCLIECHLLRSARLAELAEYRERFGQVRATLEADERDHFDFRADDEYRPHGVSHDDLTLLLDLLERCPHLEAAHLVRWTWPAFPDVTVYLLAVVPPATIAREDSTFIEIIQHLNGAPEMPGYGRLWVSSRGNPDVDQAIASVPGSLIYRPEDREDRLVA